MSDRPQKFWTSDLHFQHKNILQIRKGFYSIEDHDAFIIKSLNSQIPSSEDMLYILGDLAMSIPYDMLADYLSRIKCKKIVLLGNHDRPSVLHKLKEDKVICNWHYHKGTTDKEIPVFMAHMPCLDSHTGTTLRVQLHGHSHGNLVHNNPFMIDVGLDAQNFKVFSFNNLDCEALKRQLEEASKKIPEYTYSFNR